MKPAALPAARLVTLRDHPPVFLHHRPGKGAATLLIHGFTDCAESFRLLAPHLHGPLLIPDLPGHGSSPPLATLTIETMADALAEMIEQVADGPVFVAGHSMGALVALQLAIRHERLVRRLTIICGSLRPESPELARLATQIAALPEPLLPDDPFFEGWHSCAQPVPKEILNNLARSAAAMRRDVWLDCLKALRGADLTEAAGQVTCPVMIIAGLKDPIFPLWHAETLAKALPQARTCWLAENGHNPHWENPERIAALLA